MICSRCNILMLPSKAIEQTFVGGSPDFIGSKDVNTVYAGGPGKLIDCMKCPSCGKSITKEEKSNDN